MTYVNIHNIHKCLGEELLESQLYARVRTKKGFWKYLELVKMSHTKQTEQQRGKSENMIKITQMHQVVSHKIIENWCC